MAMKRAKMKLFKSVWRNGHELDLFELERRGGELDAFIRWHSSTWLMDMGKKEDDGIFNVHLEWMSVS